MQRFSYRACRFCGQNVVLVYCRGHREEIWRGHKKNCPCAPKTNHDRCPTHHADLHHRNAPFQKWRSTGFVC